MVATDLSASDPGVGVSSGQPAINFAAHQVRAGAHGAREDFENMIGQLIRAIRPGARMIAANPGDWGIDVLVGDLGGAISIWQSKYFLPEVNKSHQSQIRESFKSARESASAQGYKINQWVLCVPSSMDGPTAKWWDGWKKRESKKHSIVIDLWDETELRGLLISPDANHVRDHYYSPRVNETEAESARALVDLDPEAERGLDKALFVRQLSVAGHSEFAAAKRQFFNAEILAREISDKGVESELIALSTADAVIHSIWEDLFNDTPPEPSGGRIPGLHLKVMREIREKHEKLSSGLPSTPVHSCGLMHRVVDSRRAGWVKHWRDVADNQSATSSTEQATDGHTQDNWPGVNEADLALADDKEVPTPRLPTIQQTSASGGSDA